MRDPILGTWDGEAPRPPIAEIRPHELHEHGQVRVDDYYWLNRRDDSAVIDYLNAENAYTEAVLAPAADLEESLFDEIVSRIKPTDLSVPYRLGDYLYYARFEEGKEYPIHCRKAWREDECLGEDNGGGAARGAAGDPDEEILVDVNVVAEAHDYCHVAGLAVSHEQDILAYGVDLVGRRIYTIRFRNLTTGEDLPDEIPSVTANVAWAADNRTLFYAVQDPDTLRNHRIVRHKLGDDPSDDTIVYEETDNEFNCFLQRSKSKRFILITSFRTLTTEVRVLEADDPDGAFRVLVPRVSGHQYHVDHFGDFFYITTNLDAPNFRLVRAPLSSVGTEAWEEVIAHRDDVLIETFDVFRDHLVVSERWDGLMRLRVRSWSGGEEHYVDFGEPAYLAFPTDNHEIDTGTMRYTYTSMTTPESTFDYDMTTREKNLLKRQEVIGDFDPGNYRTERLHAVADDGTRVPISLAYRTDRFERGARPLLLYAYGSYGISMDATFASPRLSLLDRGFVFAIAHVRGGQELGRRWYDAGRLLAKQNTFTDFIACAEHLAREGYAKRDEIFAVGGSAGGLLMGAVANLRPDLWRGIVAHVPFVDVVTTMLDDSIPLTTGEYNEWGNPHDKTSYDCMLSYSPYDNVRAGDYPNILATTGLHDSQVQYWEPAKWVAKLRARKTDGNLVLLRTNMDAGHGGQSGRFRRHRETAQVYAFLLGLTQAADA